MRTELKTVRFTCDFCRKSIIIQDVNPWRPSDWDTVEVRGCGMTGYTDYRDRCPDCQKGKKGER